ncbi:reticulon family protein [Striga asiatica]|uniref:Reticulon family protein n=1 Tax=Striga asiatica TaxID=4170 RepID=A0A5A7PIV6_STRAF|nr:reticulon family protein [Striga asiatica]
MSLLWEALMRNSPQREREETGPRGLLGWRGICRVGRRGFFGLGENRSGKNLKGSRLALLSSSCLDLNLETTMEVALARDPPVVHAPPPPSPPQPLEETRIHTSADELSWVGTTPRPVDPRQRSVGVPRRKTAREHAAHEGRKVVLVRVARPLAIAFEGREVGGVGDDLECQVAVDREPLGALAPVGEAEGRGHVETVAAAAHWAWEVVGLDEGVVGAEEVGVDGGEVVERDARLRQEDEPLV